MHACLPTQLRRVIRLATALEACYFADSFLGVLFTLTRLSSRSIVIVGFFILWFLLSRPPRSRVPKQASHIHIYSQNPVCFCVWTVRVCTCKKGYIINYRVCWQANHPRQRET
ncbi:hypothetical protein LY78DRAFT_181100 [Colletotrichum sublineola]|nr:hypothetical protein LY78DRAFT_181100 [Colletotrichum sublineola]